MDCPNGCGKMVQVSKKQITGMGRKPKQFNVRYQCEQCSRIKEVVIEE